MHVYGPIGQFVGARVVVTAYVVYAELRGLGQRPARRFEARPELFVLHSVLAVELADHELRIGVQLDPCVGPRIDRAQRVQECFVLGLVVGQLPEIRAPLLDELSTIQPAPAGPGLPRAAPSV